MASLSYQAVKITHADWGFPGYGPTVLLVQVSPEVLDFQANLVAAVTPDTLVAVIRAAYALVVRLSALLLLRVLASSSRRR